MSTPNWQIVRDTLRAKNYNDNQIAGILGNLQQESQFSTTVKNQIGRLGMAQWDTSRWTNLQSYARENNLDPLAPVTQALFIDYELKGDQKYFMNTTNWETCSDPSSCAIAFEKGFERSGGDSLSRRISYANNFSNNINNDSYDPTKAVYDPSQFVGLDGTGTAGGRNGSAASGDKVQIRDLDCSLPKAQGSNPIHDLKNYTYRLIISSLSVDDYNKFVSSSSSGSGQTANIYPKDKTILVASGGYDIGKKNEYGVQDFYFEDLVVSTIPTSEGTTGADGSKAVSYSSDIEFTLLEPLGTTLFERLFYAGQNGATFNQVTDAAFKSQTQNEKVNQARIKTDSNVLQSLTEPVFLLTIEFKGYGKNPNTTPTGLKSLGMLSRPGSNGQADYNKKYYIPFIFSSIDTDITSAGTKYRCKALPAASQVFFSINQALPSTSGIKENQKLSEALKELSDRYTDNQKNLPKEFKKVKYVFRIVEDTELAADETEAKSIARQLRTQAEFRPGVPADASRITFMPPKTDEQKKDGRIPGGNSGTTPFRVDKNQIYYTGMGTTAIEIIHQIMLKTDFITKQVELARAGEAKQGIWWYNIRGNMLFDTENDKNKSPHVERGKTFEYIIEPYKIYIMNDMENNGGCTAPPTLRNYEYIFTGKNKDIIKWDITFDALLYTELQTLEPTSTTAQSGQPSTNSGQAINASGQQRGQNIQTKVGFPTLSDVSSQGNHQKLYKLNWFGTNEKNGDAGRVKNYAEMQNAQFMESLFRQQTSSQQLELDMDIIGDPEFLASFDKLSFKRSEKKSDKSTEEKKKDRLTTKSNLVDEWTNDGQYLIGLQFKTPTDVDPISLSYKGMRAADLSGVYVMTEIKHIFRNGKFIQSLHLVGTDNKCCPEPNATQYKPKPKASFSSSKSGGSAVGSRPPTVQAVSPEGIDVIPSTNGSVSNPNSTNPVPGSRISSEFRGPGRPNHVGIDQAGVPEGTPIYAPFDGTVIRNDFQGTDKTGYGYYTMVQNNLDNVIILTAHQSQPGLVSAGTPVSQGTQVGTVGNTGGSRGAHSHTEILVPPGHPLYNSSGSINSKISGYQNYRNVNPRYYLNLK